MEEQVPESHSRRIERQDRKDLDKEVQSRQEELNEKYGKATDIVSMSEGRNGNGQTVEVEGADCPNCSGVIRVVPKAGKYPPWKEICSGGCDF